MNLLILLLGINAAISAYHHTDYQKAYNIAHSIEKEGLSEFGKCELTELQAYTATGIRKFAQADSLFQEVFDCEFESILRKAYTNYADLQYRQFNFDRRLEYLQKAYHLESTPQITRIIARHHIEIRADYETAQIWIDRHTSETVKDQAGFALLQAEFSESKRKYDQAIKHYSKAKIRAQEANLFDYELFASEGLYRAERLLSTQEEEKMINYIVWLILSVGIYYYVKKNKSSYAGINQPQD